MADTYCPTHDLFNCWLDPGAPPMRDIETRTVGALAARIQRERRATAMATVMVAGDTRPDPASLDAFDDDDWRTWAQLAQVDPALYCERVEAAGPQGGMLLTAKAAQRRQAALDAYARAYALVHPADPFEGLGDMR